MNTELPERADYYRPSRAGQVRESAARQMRRAFVLKLVGTGLVILAGGYGVVAVCAWLLRGIWRLAGFPWPDDALTAAFLAGCALWGGSAWLSVGARRLQLRAA